MSDAESYSGDAGTANAANAQQTPLSLAAGLEKLDYRPALDGCWQEFDPLDFHQRVITPSYRLPNSQAAPHFQGEPPSPTSSMAVSSHTPSTQHASSAASSHPSISNTPSLRWSTTTGSTSSVRTSRADGFVEHVLGEDEDGALIRPEARENAPKWPCLFPHLNCSEHFEDFEAWDGHCQSHFRGHLPSKVSCPYDCGWKGHAREGETHLGIWTMRKLHMSQEHSEDELDLHRPLDESTIRQLRRVGVIDNIGYQVLMSDGRLSDEHVFTTPSGPVQERRERRRERGPARR